jgi:hypothetical protein
MAKILRITREELRNASVFADYSNAAYLDIELNERGEKGDLLVVSESATKEMNEMITPQPKNDKVIVGKVL